MSQNATGRGDQLRADRRGRAGSAGIPVIAIVLSFIIGAVIILRRATTPSPPTPPRGGGVRRPARPGPHAAVHHAPHLTGLAVAVAFRAGLFNIGGEGQTSGPSPRPGSGYRSASGPSLPLVLAGSLAAGFLWGAIPGVLKAYFGAHEVITTIMLNYVGIYLAYYLANNPLRQKDLFPARRR